MLNNISPLAMGLLQASGAAYGQPSLGRGLGGAFGAFAQGVQQQQMAQQQRRQMEQNLAYQQAVMAQMLEKSKREKAEQAAATEQRKRYDEWLTTQPEEMQAMAGAFGPELTARMMLEETKQAGKSPFGGSMTGLAAQEYNRLTRKAQTEGLTPEEQINLDIATQTLTKPRTLTTPEGTYTLPGYNLPGAPAAAPTTTPPEFSPTKISGEQAMRVSMLAQSADNLDDIVAALREPDGGLNRSLAAELRGEKYFSSDARIYGPQLERTREAMLRALTGAAAPEPEVARVRNLLSPSLWDIAAGDYAAVENKMREAQQIFRRYVDITAPGRDLGVPEAPAVPDLPESQPKRYKFDPESGQLVPK